MDKTKIAFMSVAEQGRLIKSQKISPVDLVEMYLERIERWNPILHAWTSICEDLALEQARPVSYTHLRAHET